MARTSQELPPQSQVLAPGTRVVVRSEEWVVEKCLPVPTGGYAVHVNGLTELVEHHKAIFLTELDKVEALRPEDTKLVPDNSPEYRQTRLFLETLMRRTPPVDSKIHMGHKGAIEVMPYQLKPARLALDSLRPRLLIADGVGLGKTIEVGILLSELMKRGKGRRILVVAIKSMLAQFQEELWSRFTIPLVRLDSVGIQKVQSRIPSNRNPFTYYDRVIISVDTLKNNARYRAWLEQTRWDAVVVDECHNVANRGSQRARLARLLAATTDSLILTSATPHNGRAESFAHLMQLLDPTSVADEQEFSYEDIKHLFVRRFKKNIEGEASMSFSEREIHVDASDATPAEEAALAALRSFSLHTLGRKRHGQDRLFKWTLLKAFLSSPAACLETVNARLKRIDKETSDSDTHPYREELLQDADKLRDLRALVEACLHASSKEQRLLEELAKLGFDGTAKSPRVIIFSERIKTLSSLEEAIRKRFKIKDSDTETIVKFHASIGDSDQTRIVESFGKEDAKVRLLLASDAASEGVNLHYYCNQLFHYDVPWSLIRIEQRMGRIDRYGQKHTPHLHYLLTKSSEQSADQVIIKRLIKKEEQVYKQLGEAGVVLGLYDADREDEFLTEGLAGGKSPEELIPDTPMVNQPSDDDDEDNNDEVGSGINLFDLLAQGQEADACERESIAEATTDAPSLYEGDYGFTVQALRQISEANPNSQFPWEKNDKRRAIEIWPPESFTRWRQPFLPDEAVPEANQAYKLVADPEVIFAAMSKAREHQGKWPEWQLLWEQHPIFEWMLDSLAAAYARNEAPCICAPQLGVERGLYIFQAVLSNQGGQPIHSGWFGLPVKLKSGGAGVFEDSMPMAEALKLTGFSEGLSNAGAQPSRTADLEALIPQAVAHAKEYVAAQYQDSLKAIRKDVRKAARRVEDWQQASLATIDAKALRSQGKNRGAVLGPLSKRLADRRKEIEQVSRDHQGWLASLQDHGEPYVRLCAVFVGDK